MFHSLLGAAYDGGNLGVREAVEVEKDEPFFVGRQLFDEEVEPLNARVGGVVGEGVAETGVDGCSVVAVAASVFSQFHGGGVECHAVEPGCAVALTPEAVPSQPEVADNLLVEVVDAVGLPVGEGQAHTVQHALRLAKHLLKFYMSFSFIRHILFLSAFAPRGSYIYVRCKKGKKVTQSMNFFWEVPLWCAIIITQKKQEMIRAAMPPIEKPPMKQEW